jgi:hypothetical protein
MECVYCFTRRPKPTLIEVTVNRPSRYVYRYAIEIAANDQPFHIALQPSDRFGAVYRINPIDYNISSLSTVHLKVVYFDSEGLWQSHQHHLPGIFNISSMLTSISSSLESNIPISERIELEDCDGGRVCQRVLGYCIEHPFYQKRQ